MKSHIITSEHKLKSDEAPVTESMYVKTHKVLLRGSPVAKVPKSKRLHSL